jgi:hypothetical protein
MRRSVSEGKIDGIYRELCRRETIAHSKESERSIKELIVEVCKILRTHDRLQRGLADRRYRSKMS